LLNFALGLGTGIVEPLCPLCKAYYLHTECLEGLALVTVAVVAQGDRVTVLARQTLEVNNTGFTIVYNSF